MLVQLLSDTEAGSRSGAAITATHLAVSEAMREELLAAGAVPALVGCLGLQDSSVQTPAAEALAMMASDGTARMQVAGGGRGEGGGGRGREFIGSSCFIQFLSSGGVAALPPLLRSTDQRLLGAVLWAMRATAQSTAVADELCQKG